MPTNVATIIGGPCLLSYDGANFRSKGDVTLNLALETFDVSTDLYGVVDKRVAGQPITVAFTPEGRFADLAVLYPHISAPIGSLVTPRYPCGAVIAAADTIAVAATTLAAGTPVSFGTTGTMPGGLAASTVYYLGADVAGVRIVYTTAAGAIAATVGLKVDLTDAGTGSLAFIVQKPLVILGNDGTRVTLHNAAVTQMPSLSLGSQATLFGPVQFECFPKNGVAWTTANSFFTVDTAAFADAGFNPADILTQPYTLTWGAAPWSGIYTKNGITVDPSLSLQEVGDDASGVLTRRITGLAFTAKAQPQGPDLSALVTALALQGAGAARGRSLAGANLNLEGTGVYVRLYAAALVGGAAAWNTGADRIGELTWQASRTFTAGVANPLFYIGAGAPA